MLYNVSIMRRSLDTLKKLLLLELNQKARKNNEGYAIDTHLKYNPTYDSLCVRTYILKYHNNKCVNRIAIIGKENIIDYLENELKMYNK